jgi:DHA1 family inner membrane transport protein
VEEKSYKLTNIEVRLIFALAFIQFTHIVDFMILMPLGPQLMRLFEIEPHQFSFLVSAYTFSAGVSALLASAVMDRFDRKKSLLFFFAGFTVGTLLCALSPNYYSLLFARALTGAFGGILNSLIFSIIGDSVAPHKRATATGYVMTSFSIASVLGVPASLFLANHFHWHTPFYVLAALSVLFWLYVFKRVPAQRSHLSADTVHVWYRPLLNAITVPAQRSALIFYFVMISGHFSIVPFISPSMVANAGMLEAQLPLIYFIGGMLSFVSGPQVGRLADKRGRDRVFIVSSLLCLLPIFLITNLSPIPVWQILTITGLFFVVAGGRMIPATAIITGTVEARERGGFMSVMSAVQQFAAAGGAMAAGAIVTRGDHGRLLHYNVVGYFAMICTVACIFLMRSFYRSDA